jgi:hypothetical protein
LICVKLAKKSASSNSTPSTSQWRGKEVTNDA